MMFGLISWHSFERRAMGHRYVYWGAIRLDSDPLNRHPKPVVQTDPSCKEGEGCVAWDPEYIWIEPGWIEKLLFLTGFPAFLVASGTLWVARRMGVNEVVSFMITMPALLVSWYGFVGWSLDRRVARRRLRKAATHRARERLP